MTGFRDRHINRYAAIDISKANFANVESWGAHATGITEGFTLGQLDAACLNLTMTDFSSGSLSLTAGQLTAEHPDVVRGLEVVVEGGASTDITGGSATVVYKNARGVQTTRSVALSYTGGAGFTSNPINDGVAQVVSFDASGAGTLTGAKIGLAVSQKLCLRNPPDPNAGAIIHEEGASSLPTDLDSNGLFTPVSSVTAAVSVTVHYGITK